MVCGSVSWNDEPTRVTSMSGPTPPIPWLTERHHDILLHHDLHHERVLVVVRVVVMLCDTSCLSCRARHGTTFCRKSNSSSTRATGSVVEVKPVGLRLDADRVRLHSFYELLEEQERKRLCSTF